MALSAAQESLFFWPPMSTLLFSRFTINPGNIDDAYVGFVPWSKI